MWAGEGTAKAATTKELEEDNRRLELENTESRLALEMMVIDEEMEQGMREVKKRATKERKAILGWYERAVRANRSRK